VPPESQPTASPNCTTSDLLGEGLIDLKEAASYCKDSSGRKPHLATLRRWSKRGCRGHRLQAIFLGSRLMTSKQAIARFLAAINSLEVPTQNTTSRAEQAGLRLAEAGL
jgi:hypothetical protein